MRQSDHNSHFVRREKVFALIDTSVRVVLSLNNRVAYVSQRNLWGVTDMKYLVEMTKVNDSLIREADYRDYGMNPTQDTRFRYCMTEPNVGDCRCSSVVHMHCLLNVYYMKIDDTTKTDQFSKLEHEARRNPLMRELETTG